MGRVFLLDDLLNELVVLRQNGAKVVFSNGCFDILHLGHVRYLSAAKALGDFLVVGVNSDASVRKLKGAGRPVNSEDARAEVLAALGVVDAVVVFGEDTPVEILGRVKPDVHVKGGDYVAEDLPEFGVVTQNGGRVEILGFVEGYSTTGVLGLFDLLND